MREQTDDAVATAAKSFVRVANAFATPRWAALALLITMIPIVFSLQITHDAAWQMWIGRQLRHGANLYSDIIEINPPLWFWLAEPLDALAAATSWNSIDVLLGFLIICVVIALILVDHLLQDWVVPRRLVFLIAFIVVAVPFGNFAQREHFTFIVVVPYVLLIGRRSVGVNPPFWLAALVGAVAAPGLALKPHFAVVPMLLELWLRRSLIRPETMVLVVFGLAYALSAMVFEPDYFTKALPLAQKAYGQFGGFQPLTLFTTALAFVLAFFARPSRDGVSGALLVAALTFFLVYLWQMKSFAYQAIPAMGMLVLALATVVPRRLLLRDVAAIAAAIVAISPNARFYSTPPWVDVPIGSSYAALSVAPRAGWPLVEERRLRWPLRAMSLWMAPATKNQVRSWAIHDLACSPPTYLLIDDHDVAFTRMFADVVTHYRLVWRRDGLTFMILDRPMRQPASCHTFQ